MDREQSQQSNPNIYSYQAIFSEKELHDIYDAVFRDSTNQPGFFFHDFGKQLDSKSFRQWMVELKNRLSDICGIRASKQLNYQSLGRFNHQHSSGFHRDNTEEAHSFLMLGYEPTRVDSKVYVADYSKLIEEQNMSLETYFDRIKNVYTTNNDHLLSPYIFELAPFPKEHYRILLLNNNKSFEEKTFGVFHRAEVAKSLKGDERVINYMMVYLCEKSSIEYHSPSDIEDFIMRENVYR